MHTAVYFIAGALLLVTGMILLLRKLQKNAIDELSVSYPEHTRILTSPMANLFGLESAGMKQVRGNGILLLTSSQLYFRMLLPKKEVLIPLRNIVSVETPKSYLGKTKGMKLLKVNFRNDTGASDSAAWLVDHLEEWVETLRQSTGSN